MSNKNNNSSNSLVFGRSRRQKYYNAAEFVDKVLLRVRADSAKLSLVVGELIQYWLIISRESKKLSFGY